MIAKKIRQGRKGQPRAPRLHAAFAIFAISIATAFAASARAQAPSKTRAHVEALASPRVEGRLAGSNGEKLAADYLAAELEKIGAKPLPGTTDFRMPFEFTAGTRDGGTTIELQGSGMTLGPNGKAVGPVVWGVVSGGPAPGAPPDAQPQGGVVRALSFSDTGDAEGAVVFAGYGIVVPDGQGLAYDSYATLDVKDKIALVLRYFPEDAEPKTKQVLARYADLRYKAMAARQRGAKAMLVVAGPASPNAG
jgi:hypothetical protein